MKVFRMGLMVVCAVMLLGPNLMAQVTDAPALPEDVGLMPLTDAVPLNPEVAAGDMEGSNDVGITAGDTVAVGWEDDAAEIVAGGRLFTMDLENIPWDQDPTGINVNSFYNDDGEPIPHTAAWGPKVKANPFGDGFGFGATAFGFHEGDTTIDSLVDVQLGASGEPGDIPAVQLYENDGTPILPVRSGATEEFADADGDIRIGDWAYLSNGNIVIAGESRQDAANTQPPINLSEESRTAIISILGPDDQFPMSTSRILEADTQSSMWHGLAVFEGGFAARVELNGVGIFLRFFNNDGTPITGDIDLSQFGEGFEEGSLNTGGRGDGVGFDGNAVDRVLVLGKADQEGFPGTEVYAGVFDSEGNIVVEPINASGGEGGYDFTNVDRIDGAIGPDGSFIVVWADNDIIALGDDRAVMGRIFNPDGTPATPYFSIDPRFDPEDPLAQTGTSRRPRVTWRDNTIIVIWESTNESESGNLQLVGRVFEYGEDETGISNWSILE